MNDINSRYKLAEIENDIVAYCTADMHNDGIYIAILRSSLIKAFEFVRSTGSIADGDHAFFLLATLRGICEEYISIVFLSELSSCDRDRVTQTLMEISFHDLVSKQTSFFETYRPFQPVIKSRDLSNINKNYEVLKQIADKTGLWTYNQRRPFPSVYYRADKCKLLDFYNFYYAFTSELVHFSPRVLLRMGWGEDPSKPSFSVNNFSAYYKDVGKFYSMLLFINMVKTYSKIVSIPPSILEFSSKVGQEMKLEIRWPEPVTFEECNIDGPSEPTRLMSKVIHELKSK
jgi:hypothetical protein